MTDPVHKIALIGMGPRGLGALEALSGLAKNRATRLHVDIFDPCPAPGAGPNFDPAASAVCWLNIPMRDIDIRPPDHTGCPSFGDWLPEAPDVDSFPTRADLGRYLTARYTALKSGTDLSIAHIYQPVGALSRSPSGWSLQVGNDIYGPYPEVLMTLGQPETTPDDQLAGWQRHADRSAAILTQAYPARALQDAAKDWAGKTVAIRGMALSAFDILRSLTEAQGGQFKAGGYIASGREPDRILPFSLNGHPPYPKPETAALDARFDPARRETDAFQTAIRSALSTDPQGARAVLTDMLGPVICRILQNCGSDCDPQAVTDWLQTEWDTPGTQETGTPIDILDHGIRMARGDAPPSIGYALGQIWRKWQNELRMAFNPAMPAPDTAKTIVGFDEGLKRYSYGPPVQSSDELKALLDAGLVDLSFAVAPDITLHDTGWKLAGGETSTTAHVMIDAVMPSPDPQTLHSPLVEHAINGGWMTSHADKLAVRTAPDGRLIDQSGDPVQGLSLLGRLALGSVIAADSLHDCFGEASHRWAQGVIDRIDAQEAN